MLQDELGVEPCDELKHLHRQVLKQDLQLEVAASTAGIAERQAPIFQLPSAPAGFVGRREFIDRILSELAPSHGDVATVPIIVLSGPPGVGKTALAVHVGHLLREAYPGGSLYVNMRGFSSVPAATASEALVRLLRTLGIPADRIPHDTDEQASFFRAVLTGRRILLVIDNAASPNQVRPMLPSVAGSAVIVTSRHRLHGLVATNGARPVAIGPMQPDEATSLLIAVLGNRAEDDPRAAARLAALCGYLPLAMRIAAASLAIMPTWSIAAYTEWLSVEDRVLALATDDDDVAVERAFELSYETLDEALARLFRLLSIVPGPDFDRYVAANLLQVSLTDAERMLDGLVAVNLLQSQAPLRYHFHDLIANYARLLLERHDGRDAAIDAGKRLCLYYIHTASAARHLLYPNLSHLRPPSPPAGLIVQDWPDQAGGRDWFETEAVNLEAVIRDDRNRDLPRWVLADAMLTQFDRTDRDWLDIFVSVQVAAERSADGRGRAAVYQGLARVQFKRWELDEARDNYQRAAEASRDASDVFAECRAMNGLGCVAAELEEYREAIELWEGALALLGETGDEPSQVITLINYGLMMGELGREPEGLEALTTADAISNSHNLIHVQPRIRSSLAISAHWQGRLAEAARGYNDALEMWRRLRVEAGQAHSLRNLAEVYLEAGRPEEAARLALDASSLSEKVGDAWLRVGAVATLGRTALARGQRSLALEYLLDAQQLHPSGPGYWGSFIALGLAACARLAGDGDRAVELTARAVADQRPRYSGQGRLERGRAYLMLGLTEAAAADANAALQIARDRGYLLVEAHALGLHGQFYDRVGDHAQADHYRALSGQMLARIKKPD
jgi:tetratricopeptide (TPR) repeat protein